MANITLSCEAKNVLIRFPYSTELVERIRFFWYRKWEPNQKAWLVPRVISFTSTVQVLRDLFNGHTIVIDKSLQTELDKEDGMYKAATAQNDSPLNVSTKLPLFPFQLDGVNFIHKSNGRCLIADSMGLGKSAQAIGYMIVANIKKAIVICPASLKYNWGRELEKFSNFTYQVMLNGKDKVLPDKNVYILNYDIVGKRTEEILAIQPELVIYDESHYIKNPDANRTKIALDLATKIPKIILLSVGGDSWVTIQHPNNTIEHCQIQDFVSQFSIKNEEWYYPKDKYFIRSFDGHSFVWKPLKGILKHKSNNKKTYRIKTAKGRTILMTEDHSCYRVIKHGLKYKQNSYGVCHKDQGILELIKTTDLKVGDYLLLENQIDTTTSPITEVNMLSFISGNKNVYISGQFFNDIEKLVTIGTSKRGVKDIRYRQKYKGPYGSYLSLPQYIQQYGLNISPNLDKIYVKASRHTWCRPAIPVEKIAYLLGYYIGDGTIDRNRITLYVDTPHKDKVLSLLIQLKEYAELRVSYGRQTSQYSEIRITNKILRDFIYTITKGHDCYSKEVPNEVFQFSKEAIRKFIEGIIDSDGHITKQRGNSQCVFICTVSKKLAYTLLELLKFIGIIANINISDEIGKSHISSKGIIINKCLRYNIYFPYSELIGRASTKCGIKSHFYTEFDGFPVKIKSISEENVEYVYDFSVDTDDDWQTFVANGLLVHNTGTPIMNRPKELYSQIKAINPDILPPYSVYAYRYCAAITETIYARGGGRRQILNDRGASHLAELENALRHSVMIRRRKEEVLKDLPEKIKTTIPIVLENYTQYKKSYLEMVEKISKAKHEYTQLQSALDILSPDERKQYFSKNAETKFSRARLSGYMIQEIEHIKQIVVRSKIDKCIEILKSSAEQTKIVVFAHHHEFIDKMMMELAEYNPVKITGNMDAQSRQDSVDTFQNDENCKVIVLSIRAGAVGITLTAASTVFFVELDWNPSIHQQASDRCHRIGQKNTVNVYYLIATDTIEEQIANIIDAKASVVTAATDVDPSVEPGIIESLDALLVTMV